MSVPAKLHALIAAVCPIDGVSFGDLNDKRTWVIQAKSEATAKQKADAGAIMAAYDWQAGEAMQERLEQYKRVAALKAEKAEADTVPDSAASAAIQTEIDAATISSNP